MGIIGAGAVGVEFASSFHRFGTKVTRVRNAAAHCAGRRRRSLEGTGAAVQEERHPRRNRRARRKYSEDRQRREVLRSRFPTASRRMSKPRSCWSPSAASPSPKISASKAHRVELDRGFIKVDEYQQHRRAGRLRHRRRGAGTPLLAHVATAEGMVAIAHIAGKPATPINKNRIPNCTYTEPGIGSVGLDRSAGARRRAAK